MVKVLLPLSGRQIMDFKILEYPKAIQLDRLFVFYLRLSRQEITSPVWFADFEWIHQGK